MYKAAAAFQIETWASIFNSMLCTFLGQVAWGFGSAKDNSQKPVIKNIDKTSSYVAVEREVYLRRVVGGTAVQAWSDAWSSSNRWMREERFAYLPKVWIPVPCEID